MKVLCAWCKPEYNFMYNKAPLEDDAVTHGICQFHVKVLRKEAMEYIARYNSNK